jgi:hypothetical protein
MRLIALPGGFAGPLSSLPPGVLCSGLVTESELNR